MAIGSGLAGQFGIATETVFGTYVAPSRFYRITKAEVKKVKNVEQGGGLAAGQLAQPGAMRVVTSTAAEGSIELEVPTTKFGLLLQHLFGTTVTPVQQGVTTAYLQTHPIADNFGKSLTVQSGVPNRAGTVVPFTMTGTKIVSAEFSCERNGLLTVTLELDGKDETESQTLATASYTAANLFSFKDLTVKLGASVGTEASVSGVKKISVKLERPMDTEAIYAGSAGTKSEQVMNDWVKVSGTIEADFLDKTVFNDRFANDTPTSLVALWSSSLLAGPAYPFSFELDVPQVFFDTDSPTLEGPDVVSGAFGFTAQYDLTNALITAKYVSTDVAV